MITLKIRRKQIILIFLFKLLNNIMEYSELLVKINSRHTCQTSLFYIDNMSTNYIMLLLPEILSLMEIPLI